MTKTYDVSRLENNKNTQKVVIIGAGLAGWAVVDALRAKDKAIGITLISKDDGHRYHKPMLSVAISQGKKIDDLVRNTGSEASDLADIQLMPRMTVESIDSQTQTLTISNEEMTCQTINYNILVLALGASPIFPANISRDLVCHVNDLDHFNRFLGDLNRVPGVKHIAVLGAGMVGTEMAEDLAKAGHDVSLIDMNASPLGNMLPNSATKRIKDALINIGVKWYGNTKIDQITRKQGFLELVLSSVAIENQETEILDADGVLISTGLRVDDTLPKQLGLDFDEKIGIRVAEKNLQTSIPNVYAIGDCMSINDVPCRYVAPLRAQASAIADSILGIAGEGYTHNPPMIRLKNKSISMVATGLPTPQGNWRVITETDSELNIERMDNEGNVVATVSLKQTQV